MPKAPPRTKPKRLKQTKQFMLRLNEAQWTKLLSKQLDGVSLNQSLLELLGLSDPSDRPFTSAVGDSGTTKMGAK